MSIEKFVLNNSTKIPKVGLGTWQAAPNEVGNAVKKALELGYRSFDCAAIYGNEAEIGTAFSNAFNSGIVKREDLFITTKLWNTEHRNVKDAFETSLKKLNLKYLDLYLIHWPLAFAKIPGESTPRDENQKIIMDNDASLEETWREMENLYFEGRVKAIGVSNFGIEALQRIMKSGRVKPQVNQIELHPFIADQDFMRFCQENDIHLTAYSPFGVAREPSLFSNETIVKVAKNEDISPSQVLISWILQKGCSAIPKSTNADRLKQNLVTKTLSEESVKAIDSISIKHRFIDPKVFWGINVFNE